MKKNTMLLGAFLAGVTTTYILQQTKVFGSETRVFGADCNSQGYETNAPNGYTGETAIITLDTHPDYPNCTNPPCIKVTYTGGGAGGNGVAAHYFTGVSGNPLTKAKRFAVQSDDTGYWIDKTVSANTADCDPICPSCPTCPTCPTCAKCDSCCPEPPTFDCADCAPPFKCDSCCPECPDCSKPSKHPSQPQGREIKPSRGPIGRFFRMW